MRVLPNTDLDGDLPTSGCVRSPVAGSDDSAEAGPSCRAPPKTSDSRKRKRRCITTDIEEEEEDQDLHTQGIEEEAEADCNEEGGSDSDR